MPSTPRAVLAEINRIMCRLDDPEFGAEAIEESKELLRNLIHDEVDWATWAMFCGLHSMAVMRVNKAEREAVKARAN